LLFRLDPATGKIASRLIRSNARSGQDGGTDIAFVAGGIWRYLDPIRLRQHNTNPNRDVQGPRQLVGL
jgi:hypothetical protein